MKVPKYAWSQVAGAILDWYAFGRGPNDVLSQLGATTRATYVPDIQGSVVASLDAASGALEWGRAYSARKWGKNYTSYRARTIR
jgi:hypothetical protein